MTPLTHAHTKNTHSYVVCSHSDILADNESEGETIPASVSNLEPDPTVLIKPQPVQQQQHILFSPEEYLQLTLNVCAPLTSPDLLQPSPTVSVQIPTYTSPELFNFPPCFIEVYYDKVPPPAEEGVTYFCQPLSATCSSCSNGPLPVVDYIKQ